MNSYCLLSLTNTGQAVHNTAGTTRGLPPRQSERDLMLDRQSSVLIRAPELLQAQSPLPALVGGEPSTEAGHWRLCAQARRGKQRFSHWVHQSSRSLALDKLSASTNYYMRGEGGGAGKGKKDTGYLYKAFMVARVLLPVLTGGGTQAHPHPRATIKALPASPHHPRPYRDSVGERHWQ